MASPGVFRHLVVPPSSCNFRNMIYYIQRRPRPHETQNTVQESHDITAEGFKSDEFRLNNESLYAERPTNKVTLGLGLNAINEESVKDRSLNYLRRNKSLSNAYNVDFFLFR